MTPVFCCGFECGVFASGMHFSSAVSATFDTTTVNNGARSLRLNGTTPNAVSSFFTNSAFNQLVVRFYWRATTLPTADYMVFTSHTRTQTGVYFKNSDTKLYASANGTLSSTGVTVTTATWYRVECKIDISANPWLVDVRVDGVATTQASSATAANTDSQFDLGATISGTPTMDMYYDDLLISQTLADYPLGAGKVLASSPVADGAHQTVTGHFVRGNSGPSILSAGATAVTTDAYLLVDEVPLSTAVNTSDFITQVTSGAGEFVELVMATATASDAPRMVNFVLGAHKVTSAAADLKIKLLDNGVTALMWQFGATGLYGSTALFSLSTGANTLTWSSMVGGGAWTKARSDALRLRVGYSTDANPDVAFDQVMMEWEFAASAAAGATFSASMSGLGSLSVLSDAPNMYLTVPITAAI